jgi:pteridine reductase
MELPGKTILITGGRRVGSALALMLADRGANVALTYHSSREAIERTALEVAAKGVGSLAVAADLADPAQAEAAVNQVVDYFGRIDALVNMASIFRRTPFDSLVPADFDAMIASNLAAPYHVAVASAKRMLGQEPNESGLKGKIVNVGDWATERPYKGYLPYLIAKGGLTTMTLALAVELAPHIAVTMVQPAMIDPPPTMTPAAHAAVVAATPLAREGTPLDLNRLILYLLEGTDYATGACYRVDGGRFLGVEPTGADG